MKLKSKKSALLLSFTSLLLCFAMLAGSTFAWFTDTATTGVNKIVAGNLKVDIVAAEKDSNDKYPSLTGTGKELKFQNNANSNDILWEPGVNFLTQGFKIANKGNLALKWKAQVNKDNITNGKASDDAKDGMSLLDVIDFSVVTSQAEDAKAIAIEDFVGHLAKEKTSDETYYIKAHMQETAGNDYQNLTLEGITITVYATQDTVEYDSFDNDYDAGADVELATSATINGRAYASAQEAYEDVQPKVSTVFGLGQEAFSASDTDKCAKFDELFPDGKITWTIYGEQKLTDPYMLSFGRKASYFGARTLKEIEVVGGNSQATLDLTEVNGTFALPYNWWGDTVDNIKITFKGITFKGIKSIPGTWATPEQETPYTFENCTFNGSVYGYHDYNINLTIKNCTFNAPENTKYALMLQSTTGITGKVTVEGCTFNGYTRGINFQRPNTEFIFTNNTIRSTVSEPDRGAIQLTDGKSFVVTGNTVDVNAGNAFWFHDAATNGNVTYTISNNDIKAPYIGYYGTSFNVNDKITSSGNKFNSTDTTKCMKKNATVAEATNLTAIH